MEENLYDEFGNYIGPELSVSDDGDDSGEEAKSNSSGEYQQINTVSCYTRHAIQFNTPFY